MSWGSVYEPPASSDDGMAPPAYTPPIEESPHVSRRDTKPPAYKEKDEKAESQAVEGDMPEFTGEIEWIRRKCDYEIDSDDEPEEEAEPVCQLTYTEDEGHEFTDDYVTELEDELEDASERLSTAEKKLLYWRDLYWKSRDDYYFSHGAVNDAEGSVSSPAEVVDEWESLYGDLETKKMADQGSWHDIQLSEFHLHQLELDVGEAKEDVQMIKSELLICKLRIDVRPPETWRFDDGLGLRIWNPLEGKQITADDFLVLPGHRRHLAYGNQRFN
ncbi:hypothetical protein SCUP515_13352 [Seiridium cupressi]